MVLCCRAVQGIKKDKKRIKEAGPFAAWLRGLPFLPTNHLQHLLPGDFAGNTVVLSVHGLREIHRNRIGKVSETCKTERSELPPLPSKFLIFPLPFLIFSGAPEHSTPVRFLAKLENDFAPYRLFSAIFRGAAGARSFFFFAKRHTDFPFLQNFTPPGTIFGKNGFQFAPKGISNYPF